jgi:DNA-binding MarR family transcriptional regulator
MPADRQKLLLDLFTEVAVVEHLCRNYIDSVVALDLTPGQFGALNYFIRNNRDRERKAILAWLFQVSPDEMETHLAALEQRGFIRREPDGDDQVIVMTEAGRNGHADALARMAPEFEPLMSEFADEDLDQALNTLQEIRRVFDNLPER